MFIFEYYRFIQFTAITLSRPRTYLKSQGWRAAPTSGRSGAGRVYSRCWGAFSAYRLHAPPATNP